ncbi:YjgB family protein [Brevibacillus ruminantium]|uniref:YjgB family protein n=1 Tax=Brevibacillus ruminantium TaxID=2950604 RepID=A0ABY4WDF7_9BACL|nr:YjgB family protein [Brevibacillus ruminantium]USG65225.1 YjgB family protein [Brevibacillus ruminantium]
MPSNYDKKLLEELRNLPDIKLQPKQKEKIIMTIRNTHTGAGTRTFDHRRKKAHRLAPIARTAAACTLLVATVWLGSQLINWNQSAGPAPTTPATDQQPPGSTGPEGSPQGSGIGTGTGGAGTGGAGVGVGAGAGAVSDNKEETLIRTIKEKAMQGQVFNQNISLETSMFDELEQAWGKPDRTDSANGIMYATYGKKGVVLGYNKGMQIVDIRTNDPQLHSLSLEQVKRILGEPARVNSFAGQTIHIYNITDKYQLKIVYQGIEDGKSELRAVRTYVFYPRGTVNLMLYGNATEMLTAVRDMAKEGKLLGVEYPVENSVFDTVEKEWGKPDRLNMVNGISYASYRIPGIVFAFNKGMQIVDIRSYDTRLQALTPADVKTALGKPTAIANVAGETIYTYNVTDEYELKFVFSGIVTPQNEKTLLVDHVNLQFPRGMKNLMAQ